MDFSYTPEQQKWREEVRSFIKEHPPANYRTEIGDEGYGLGGASKEFTRELGKRRWIGLCFPTEFGGLGRPLVDLCIMKDELARHGAPAFAHMFAETVGASIIAHGTEQQKRWFLPKIASGEMIWATALSEPDAGSDLFGMQSKAVQMGDYFVVNGKKIWNTMAHLSDWALLVAITDTKAPRSRGLSTFLVDLKTPGISVRPVIDMALSSSFTEIFFDDVKIPAENLLGPLNKGFPQLMEALEGDRFWARMTRPAATRRMLDLIIEYCKTTNGNNGLLSEDTSIQQTLAQIAIDVEVCRGMADYVMSLLAKGTNVSIEASYEESVLKTFADELGRRAANTWMQILGPKGQLLKGSKHAAFAGGLFEGLIPFQYLFAPGYVLAGGTTQMQRTNIATYGLKLPRG